MRLRDGALVSRLAHAAFRWLLGAVRLLSMRLQRSCPHAEEPRRGVSKYEVVPAPPLGDLQVIL
jgi:hypothetical protein